MRTFTLLSLLLLLTFGSMSAQRVEVLSPDSLAGFYDFGIAAGFGPQLTDSVWMGEAVLALDGSANPTFACDSIINPDEVAGKIALIDRGACAFVQKALNAQAAGAIAVVIFHNVPGEAPPALGGSSADVTIPVVRLSTEAGQSIKAAIANGATIIMRLGDIRLPNDIGIRTTEFALPPYAIYPKSQIREEGDFVIQPGLSVVNLGENAASNVVATATIARLSEGEDPEVLYAETADAVASLAVDSLSDVILFPEFSLPADAEEGDYVLTYNVVGDSTELDISFIDNSVSTPFRISDNLISKARWDSEFNLPTVTTGYTVAAGGAVEFVTFFDMPYADNFSIDSVYAAALVNTGTPLGDALFEAYVYEWTDLNGDSLLNNDEITILGLGSYVVPSDFDGTFVETLIPIFDLIDVDQLGVRTEGTDKVYGVGIRYTGTESVFIGFDTGVDYTFNNSFLIETEPDASYWLVTDYEGIQPDVETGGIFTDAQFGPSTGIYISDLSSGVNDLATDANFTMALTPNPTSDVLRVNLTLNESSSFLVYGIMDIHGRVISNERKQPQIGEDQLDIDVSQLPAGQYIMRVITEQGLRAQKFSVVR